MKPQCPGCRDGSHSIVRDGSYFRHPNTRLGFTPYSTVSLLCLQAAFLSLHPFTALSAEVPAHQCPDTEIHEQWWHATDEHKRYPAAIKKHSPGATHNTYKSIRGCVTGQGEMKKAQFDPLFTVNHTLAMLRARINRLVRRTWCTTKKNERLHDHLALYIDYHNRVLINNPAR